MSMLNLKELDSMHLSVLAEIGNIGSGNAATALAGLLNTPVDIEVPNICLMDYTKAADYLGGADKTAIGMTVIARNGKHHNCCLCKFYCKNDKYLY